MDKDKLFAYWQAEYQKPFSGWDFSYIMDRISTAPLDWSYTSQVITCLPDVRSLLDMDTGGGEVLSRLAPLPIYTCATEGYLPNIPVARSRLEPLGVQVFEYEEEANLPFANNQFELVTNRHGSYSAKELWRIMCPGGQFISQQVGAENDLDLNRLLSAPVEVEWENWNLSFAVKGLKNVGFEILIAKECFPETRIFDIGALVYFLAAIPWQVEGFSVELYKEHLFNLHEQILHNGYLSIRSHRFLIVAQKPFVNK